MLPTYVRGQSTKKLQWAFTTYKKMIPMRTVAWHISFMTLFLNNQCFLQDLHWGVSDIVVQKGEEEKQGSQKRGKDWDWLLQYCINSRVKQLGGGPDVTGQTVNMIGFQISEPPNAGGCHIFGLSNKWGRCYWVWSHPGLFFTFRKELESPGKSCSLVHCKFLLSYCHSQCRTEKKWICK